MATAHATNDIQYLSDPGIHLQSLTHHRNGVGPNYEASSHDLDKHGLYQNGNGGIGPGSSSSVLCPPPSSSDFVVVVTEEEGTPPRTDPPKDYLGFSLCIMIVCCFPIGLTAVQSSKQCRRAISMRNMTIADSKSVEAKGRACLGLITGITTWIVVAAFIVLGVLS